MSSERVGLLPLYIVVTPLFWRENESVRKEEP